MIKKENKKISPPVRDRTYKIVEGGTEILKEMNPNLTLDEVFGHHRFKHVFIQDKLRKQRKVQNYVFKILILFTTIIGFILFGIIMINFFLNVFNFRI